MSNPDARALAVAWKRIEVLEAALSNCADFIEDVRLTDAKDKKLKPVMLRMCKTAITRKEGKK